MPYETPNGCVYDSGDYARCLDIALELIDYEGARARQAAKNVKIIGIGIGSHSRDAETTGRMREIWRGSALDSGTNNSGQSPLLNPELQFSGNNEVATIKLDI